MDLSVKHLRDLFGGNIPVAQVLQSVASGMADCGVNVVIDPNTTMPYAIPEEKKIVLPAHVRSEKALLVVSWNVDHESGHIIYTPPYGPLIESWLKNGKVKDVCATRGYPKQEIPIDDYGVVETEVPMSIIHAVKFFHNMCEDSRIEHLMISRWPGTKKHFIGGPIAASAEHMVADTIAIAEEKKEQEGLKEVPISPFFIAMTHAHGLMDGWHGQKELDYVRDLAPESVHWVCDIVDTEFDGVNPLVISCEELMEKADIVSAQILEKLLTDYEEPPQGSGQGQGQQQPGPGQPGGPKPPDPFDDEINPNKNRRTVKQKGEPQEGDEQEGGGGGEQKGEPGESSEGSDGSGGEESSDSNNSNAGGGLESDDDDAEEGSEGSSSKSSGDESGEDDSDSDSGGSGSYGSADDDESDSEDGDSEGVDSGGDSGEDGESESESSGATGEGTDESESSDESGSDECDECDGDDGEVEDTPDDNLAEDGDIDTKALPKQIEEWAKEAQVDLSELIRASGSTDSSPGGQPQGPTGNQSGAPTSMEHAKDVEGMPDKYLESLATGARVVVIQDQDLGLLFSDKDQTFRAYDEAIRSLMPPNLGPAARRLIGRFKGAPGKAWTGNRLNPKMLQRIQAGRAYGQQLFLRRNEPTQSRKGVAVMVAIDCSGSMCESVPGLNLRGGRNSKFAVSHAAARGIARLLQTVNVPFALMGFLATSMKYGRGSYNASRHCDIVNFLFKDFHEPWTTCEQRMLAMNPNTSVTYKGTHISPHTNSDGESLLWGATQIITREESRKIMIVISDGLPYAGNTHLQSQFLKWAVRRIEIAGIKIGGLGLGDDGVKHYYRLYELIPSFPPGMGTDLMAPLYIQEKILKLIDTLTME